MLTGLFDLGERKPVMLGDYYIAPSAAVIGSVILGHEATVWFNAVVRGDNDNITLGAGVNVQDSAVLHVDDGVPLVLEDGASVGHMAMLHGCTVRAGALIGINAVVLNHADIGRDSLIGANALVAEGKQIPERSLVLGSPGRVVRELNDDEVAGLRAVTRNYIEKGRQYRASLVARSA